MTTASLNAADLLQIQQLSDLGLTPSTFESVLDIKDSDHRALAVGRIEDSTKDIVDSLMLAENAKGRHGGAAYDSKLRYKHNDSGKTVNEHFSETYGRAPKDLNELARHFGEVRDSFTGYADTPAAAPSTPASSGGAATTGTAKKDSFINGLRQTPAQASTLEKLLQERTSGKGKK